MLPNTNAWHTLPLPPPYKGPKTIELLQRMGGSARLKLEFGYLEEGGKPVMLTGQVPDWHGGADHGFCTDGPEMMDVLSAVRRVRGQLKDSADLLAVVTEDCGMLVLKSTQHMDPAKFEAWLSKYAPETSKYHRVVAPGFYWTAVHRKGEPKVAKKRLAVIKCQEHVAEHAVMVLFVGNEFGAAATVWSYIQAALSKYDQLHVTTSSGKQTSMVAIQRVLHDPANPSHYGIRVVSGRTIVAFDGGRNGLTPKFYRAELPRAGQQPAAFRAYVPSTELCAGVMPDEPLSQAKPIQ